MIKHNNFIVWMAIFALFLPVSPARADCTNPAGVEGDQIYNTTHKTMQFCNGTTWYSMKGGGSSGGVPSGTHCGLATSSLPAGAACTTFTSVTTCEGVDVSTGACPTGYTNTEWRTGATGDGINYKISCSRICMKD